MTIEEILKLTITEAEVATQLGNLLLQLQQKDKQIQALAAKVRELEPPKEEPDGTETL